MNPVYLLSEVGDSFVVLEDPEKNLTKRVSLSSQDYEINILDSSKNGEMENSLLVFTELLGAHSTQSQMFSVGYDE